MKRIYYFLIIALFSLIYFNNGAPPEIADRIMIHAVGIDRTQHGYNVTMQVFSPSGTGSDTAIDPSLPNVSLVSGKGITVNDAMKDCIIKLGGNVFLGQNRMIIFGKSIDLSKKDDIFGYFLASSDTFMNVDCAMAENTAAEILSVPIPGSAISSEKYPDMIEAAAADGRCLKTTFLDVIDSLESHDIAVILPIFSKTQKQTEGKSSDSAEGKESGGDEALPESELEIKNGALIVGGRARAQLTYEQMGIAGMLNGMGEYIRTEIKYDGVSRTKTFKLRSREVNVTRSGDDIDIYITCRLSPKDAQIFHSKRHDHNADMEAVKLLEKKSQALCDQLCAADSPELLNADLYLKRYFPSLYRQNKDDLDRLYKNISYHIKYM